MPTNSVDSLVQAWQEYLKAVDWTKTIQGFAAKQSGCGLIYELPNPLSRPAEDFSIADMRKLLYTEPHFHPAPDIEVYFVLQGHGLMVVGDNEQQVAAGSVIVIPPDTAHFTIPTDMVIAVVNTPPFKPDRYIPLTETNPSVGFDYQRFTKLTSSAK
ncbi:MAG TPA: cupin domain-containing protein [Candidatus Limnocylindrales bacterium]|nr:cupin domain-containing protein [Candidatus Limnocylindrales bacterium]